MLRRRAARFACGLLCSAILVAFYVLVINAKVYGQMKEQRLWNHPQAFAALAYHGSPLFCLAAAAVVLTTSLHTGPLSTLVSAILRSKVFKNLAKVNYYILPCRVLCKLQHSLSFSGNKQILLFPI
jgi:Mn2+/Fe2+ NRAMP family transporter